MITTGTALILLLLTGLFGIALGYLLRFLQMTVAKARLEVNVRKTIAKARAKAAKILSDTYEETAGIRRELEDRLQEITGLQTRLTKDKQVLVKNEAEVKEKTWQLEELIARYQNRINQLADKQNIDRNKLITELKGQISNDLSEYYEKSRKNHRNNLEAYVQKLLAEELPNITRRTVRNATSTTISVAPDEIGKIIGRDGVNIKSFERYAGVDLVIDDDQNTVTISTFDPKRRLVAKQSLLNLLEDGRINRESIYSTVENTESQLRTESLGLLDAGIAGLGVEIQLNPVIKDHLAALYFRHSYGQNQLEHALETAEIAGKLAKRIAPNLITEAVLAGLLHDIGKTAPDSTDHVAAGVQILKQNNLPSNVIAAVANHHNEIPENLLVAIVQSADTLSSARPGARSQSTSSFFNWLQSIETELEKHDAVDNAYVVSGGKEVQIFIKNHKYNTANLHTLATTLANNLKSANLVHSPIIMHLIREDSITKKVA